MFDCSTISFDFSKKLTSNAESFFFIYIEETRRNKVSKEYKNAP